MPPSSWHQAEDMVWLAETVQVISVTKNHVSVNSTHHSSLLSSSLPTQIFLFALTFAGDRLPCSVTHSLNNVCTFFIATVYFSSLCVGLSVYVSVFLS